MKSALVLGFVVVSVLSLASVSQAQTVKEKKAMAKGQEMITKAVDKAKAACGNSTLTAKFDFAPLLKMTTYMKESDRESDNFLETAAGTAAEAVGYLSDICEDKDYKEEAAKLTKIEFVTKSEKFSDKVKFTKKGTTLVIEHDPVYSSSGVGFDAIKKVF